jgi:hypothetical protein
MLAYLLDVREKLFTRNKSDIAQRELDLGLGILDLLRAMDIAKMEYASLWISCCRPRCT